MPLGHSARGVLETTSNTLPTRISGDETPTKIWVCGENRSYWRAWPSNTMCCSPVPRSRRGWGFPSGKDALAACAHPGEAWSSHQSPQDPPSWCSLPAMFYDKEKDNKANSKWQPSMNVPTALCHHCCARYHCPQLGTHKAHRHSLSPWLPEALRKSFGGWLSLLSHFDFFLWIVLEVLFSWSVVTLHTKSYRIWNLKCDRHFFCCLLFDGFWKRDPASGFLPGGLCFFTYEECIFHKQLFYIANSGLLFQTDRLLLLKFPPRSHLSFKSVRVNLEILQLENCTQRYIHQVWGCSHTEITL